MDDKIQVAIAYYYILADGFVSLLKFLNQLFTLVFSSNSSNLCEDSFEARFSTIATSTRLEHFFIFIFFIFFIEFIHYSLTTALKTALTTGLTTAALKKFMQQ